VLAQASCVVMVLDGGRAGIPYGTPTVLSTPSKTYAMCNRNACPWEGTVDDLRS
jgi:hypothetical protein